MFRKSLTLNKKTLVQKCMYDDSLIDEKQFGFLTDFDQISQLGTLERISGENLERIDGEDLDVINP